MSPTRMFETSCEYVDFVTIQSTPEFSGLVALPPSLPTAYRKMPPEFRADDEIYHPELENSDEDSESDDLNFTGRPTLKYPPPTVEVWKEYNVTRDINKPRSQAYSIEWLYKQLKDNLIDLNAEYQRDVVWTKEKQSFLIDSIFNNYYVPPIIFSVRKHENGIDEMRVCIDGKQRLTAILLFLEGTIPYRDKASGRQLWFRHNPDLPWPPCRGKKYLLPRNMTRSLENSSLVCVEYEEVAYQEERDIFKRVQLGVPLTGAEKLQAISTPRVRFIQKLKTQFMVPEKLGNLAIPLDRSRCRDFHLLALSVYYATTWDFETTSSLARSDTMAKWLGEQPRDGKDIGEPGGIPVPKELQEQVIDVLNVITRLFNNPEYNKPFVSFYHNNKRKGLSPIDVVGTFLLVFKMIYCSPLHTRPELSTLSQLGEIMRRELRKGNVSLKMTSSMLHLAQRFCIEAAENPAKVLQSGRLSENFILSSSGSGGLAGKEGTLKWEAPTDTCEDSASDGEGSTQQAADNSISAGNRTTRSRKAPYKLGMDRTKRGHEGDELDRGDGAYNPENEHVPVTAPRKRRRRRSLKSTDQSQGAEQQSFAIP
ncbi:hypothetical protein PQX77_009223 [Marasmius sp. AFHP31]|nr:hypothetical protein PQX77_009223 [Marasmius sp. AFHP31]